jgi:hypothetical protein
MTSSIKILDQKFIVLDNLKGSTIHNNVSDCLTSRTKKFSQYNLKCNDEFKKSFNLVREKFDLSAKELFFSYFNDSIVVKKPKKKSEKFHSIFNALNSYNTNFTQAMNLIQDWESKFGDDGREKNYKLLVASDNKITNLILMLNETISLINTPIKNENIKNTNSIKKIFSNNNFSEENNIAMVCDSELMRSVNEFSKKTGISKRTIFVNSLMNIRVFDSVDLLDHIDSKKNKEHKVNIEKISKFIVNGASEFNSTIHQFHIDKEDGEFDTYSVKELVKKLDECEKMYSLINTKLKEIITQETTNKG